MYDKTEAQYATAAAVKDRAATVTEELAALVWELHDAIDYGSEKLANVVAPEYCETTMGDSVPQPIASPIKTVADDLRRATGRLRLLLDRVEA